MVSTAEMFGQWFSRALRTHAMSQADFHHKSGVARSTVSAWARGTRIPDTANCDVIADVLRLDLDLVLWQAGHRPQTRQVDPDDPAIEIIGLVERVKWTPTKLKIIKGVLRPMIEED